MNYIANRRLEEALRRRGRAMGLPGDPLDDAAPVADTLHRQLASVGLWLGLPRQLRRHPEAWAMAQATACGPRRRAK